MGSFVQTLSHEFISEREELLETIREEGSISGKDVLIVLSFFASSVGIGIVISAIALL